MLDKIFKTMLIFVPIAVIAHIYNFSPLIIFIVSAVAIIPLAKYIGEATEELSVYTGPALGGLLNATFGNATELIIGILALQAGLIDVVKASITGSIIGNLLLVLGSAIFFGGINRKEQKFNATAAQASGSTLLLAIIALVVPAIFLQTTSSASNAPLVEKLSIVVAVVMIFSYLASLIFSLYTHKHLYTEDVGKNEAKWSIKKSVIILLISTIVVAFMSDYLVGVIQPLVTNFGWTQLFIGVIFVAIIGNAAEHTSAITMAVKGKMDLALQVAIGSATQMAMLVAPTLVLVSLFFQTQMNLVFSTFELVAMIFSVFVVNAVIEDGSSNWFEGFQLLAAYIIMAVAFFFHP
jgi:Ca2+:H+ antiporter